MIFSNYLIGVVEDNIKLFVYPHLFANFKSCSTYFGYPTGTCIDSQIFFQPLINIPLYSLTKLINPVFLYNLVIVVGMLLNFFFSYKFFKKLFGNYISALISLIFVFSPYFAYQSRSHYELIQFWPVIFFMDVLFFNISKYKPLILGLLLTLITGISYYLGFFTILFCVLYLFAYFITSSDRITLFKNNLTPIIKGGLFFILTSAIFLFPYIKSNYFSSVSDMSYSTDPKFVKRPFEDYVIFSSRPWYYVLPSVDNPFFGDFSQSVLNKLTSTNNYLTQNYFKSEHSATYLGWINLFFALLGIKLLFKSKTKKDWKLNYSAILVTLVGLVIFTMPPSFVFKDITFYTPSLILFNIFPMFRVLSRIGVFILFLMLIFTCFGYISLKNWFIKQGVSDKLAKVMLVPFVFLSISEFLIPVKITHISEPPAVYSYLKKSVTTESPIVVYPYNKTSDAIFWLSEYRQPLINPRSYENVSANFYSEDFTEALNTDLGLEKAVDMGAKYLVYFYEVDERESIEFFDNNILLKRIANFEEKKPNETKILNFIYILESGPSINNSAILYGFK